MIPHIRELLHTAPFQPFTIRTSDGQEYKVSTFDHAAVSPGGNRLVIFGDDGSQADLAGLHVASLLINGKVEK
jgi:hypothetical protein